MSSLNVLSAALRADVPALLWGAPGTGKSAAIERLALDSGAHIEVIIASQMAPEDVGGIPYVVNGVLKIAPPAWAVRTRDAIAGGLKAWLFFDEMSCARHDVQAALLRVIQARHVADIDLKGCRIVAAANRADYAASGGDIPAATANRFSHIEWAGIDAPGWANGLLSGNWPSPVAHGGATPESRAAAKANIAAYILRNSQRLLCAPEPGSNAASGAWPSPRTWEIAALLLGEVGGANSPHATAVVASAVGATAASEWQTWSDSMDLPDPEALLAGKESVPSRADRQSAALASLVAAALIDHPNRAGRVATAWNILGKCRPDAALTPAKALMGGAPELEGSAAAFDLGSRILKVDRKHKEKK